MSLILDALERSRRDRDAPADALPLSPAAERPEVQPGGFPWVAVLLLALGLALSVIAWLWVSRSPPAADPVPAPVAVAQAPVLPGTPAAAEIRASAALPGGDRTAGRPVPDAADDEIASLYRQTREAPLSSPPDRAADTDREAEVDTLVARAREALDNRGLAAHPAPMLADLSQTRRDSIPTLMYSQHDYRDDGEPSSVFINREHCREGDSVSGVRVEEILPDSVVLRYRDTVFRLRALNSWVNL